MRMMMMMMKRIGLLMMMFSELWNERESGIF